MSKSVYEMPLLLYRDCQGRPLGDQFFGCGCNGRKKRQAEDEQGEESEEEMEEFGITETDGVRKSVSRRKNGQ